MPPEHLPTHTAEDLHSVVADVLTLAPEQECARYLPASFDPDRLTRRLELLLQSA